jgi:hypothetical protein
MQASKAKTEGISTPIGLGDAYVDPLVSKYNW